MGRARGSGRPRFVDCRGQAFANASEEDIAITLDNLIENALKYSPGGGAVTVECGAEGSEAYIAVLDEGPGLRPGEEDHVFERFARGSGTGAPGTGLGLAIVATLARRWGGSARMTNRPDGGARAEVRFPAAAGPLQTSNRDLDEALPGRV